MGTQSSSSTPPRRRRGPGKKPRMDAKQLRAYKTQRMRVSRAIKSLATAPVPKHCCKRVVSGQRINEALEANRKPEQESLSQQKICKMYKRKSREHEPPKRMKNVPDGEDGNRRLVCSQNFHGPW